MKRFMNYIFFGLFVASLVADYGCNHTDYVTLSEGKVVYEISYRDNCEAGISNDLLPAAATLYFKDNKTCMEFISASGMVNTRIISDSDRQSYSVLVDTLKQKLAKAFNKQDVSKNYASHVPLKISFSENTKIIAGVECREAICMDSASNIYSVFYSDIFKIKDPNWSTPFYEINGVLMEYEVQINNVVINLKASSVSNEKIDPGMFTIPGDFNMIKPFKNT